jgi:hypothetical protein
VIARKDGKRVKLYSRPGNDLTYRFPLIVEALTRLRPQSCIIDGEAVACGDDGIASFDRQVWVSCPGPSPVQSVAHSIAEGMLHCNILLLRAIC